MNKNDRRKRVLVIGPGMEIGGVEKSLTGFLHAIDDHETEIDLFLFSHKGELLPLVGSNIHILPENPKLASVFEPVRSLFQKGKYYTAFIRIFCKAYGYVRRKLYHTSDISMLMCQKIILRTIPQNTKKYDYAFGFYEPHYYLTDKVNAEIKIGWVHTDYCSLRKDSLFDRTVWKKLDYVACVSAKVGESFIRKYPSEAYKTIIVPNTVSPELIRAQSLEEESIPEMEGNGEFRIVTVGRYSYAKGMDMIPAVCRKLTDRGYRIKWYLIGYGPDQAKIAEEIRKQSVAELVKILGPKANPYPYMRQCDLYVQPSRFEGKSVAVTEAQILHKPVMITRYPTSSDQLDEGKDGYICETGTDGIADGIRYLIDHPDIRDALIRNTYCKDYDSSETIRTLFTLEPTKQSEK